MSNPSATVKEMLARAEARKKRVADDVLQDAKPKRRWKPKTPKQRVWDYFISEFRDRWPMSFASTERSMPGGEDAGNQRTYAAEYRRVNAILKFCNADEGLAKRMVAFVFDNWDKFSTTDRDVPTFNLVGTVGFLQVVRTRMLNGFPKKREDERMLTRCDEEAMDAETSEW